MEVLPLELTQDRLKELLHYDPETGVFTWRASRGGRVSGSVAGSASLSGYTIIRITVGSGKPTDFRAHRLAFLYMTGSFPIGDVDHIDRDRKNNRWSNLRACSRSQNLANSSIRSDNTSGVRGVSFDKERGKYLWQCVSGGIKSQGREDSLEAATLARNRAAMKLHGEFSVLSPIEETKC